MAIENTKFQYEFDGKEFTVPRVDQLKVKVVRKIQNLDAGDELFGILDLIADDKASEVIDEMTMKDLEKFFEAWQANAEVTVGESEAS